MDFIDLNDQRIPYVYIEKPIRNTYLKFRDDVLVVTSRNYGSAKKTLQIHKNWVIKHYSQIKSSTKLFSSNTFLFNGSQFEASHVFHDGHSRVEILGNKVTVHAKSSEVAERATDKWLALQTQLFTEPIAVQKAEQLGKQRPTVKVRKYGKWGVCKSDNTITFNMYLCMLPSDVREYVVSHEVAHMEQMNHSSRFWEVVSRLYPNYREMRRKIKNFDNTRRPLYFSSNAL